MQERDFEKKVQEQMQGFGLDPSPGVWAGVEQRIRKEKKRRFAAWWFFAALLLAGSGLIYFSKPGKNHEQSAMMNADQQRSTASVVKAELSKQIGQSDETKNTPAEIVMPQMATPAASAKEETQRHTRGQVSTMQARSVHSFSKAIGTGSSKNQEDGRISTTPAKNKPEDGMAGKDAVLKDKPTTGKEVLIANVQPGNEIKSIAADSVVTVKKATDGKMKTDSIAAAPLAANKIKRKSKWEKGFSFFAGKSNLSSGLNLFSGQQKADALYTNTGSLLVLSPNIIAEPQGAFTFSAGFFARKKIGAKLDFYGAFEYSWLSSLQQLGRKLDGTPQATIMGTGGGGINAPDDYYNPATPSFRQYYTNQFHYFDLTAGVSWKILNAKKHSLRWENSITYGKLLASNMVHYNDSLLVYYTNNKLINKSRIALNTGLAIPFSERFEINAGASYTPSSLLKNNNGNNRFFTRFGVGFKYLFKK